MVGMCTDCPSKQYCSTLCPEAELYAKQDEVTYQREFPVGLPSYGKVLWPSGSENFTERERQIATLLVHKLSRAEICQVLKIDRKTLRDVVHRMKKKCNGFLPL